MSTLDDESQLCVTEKLKVVVKGEPYIGCSALELVVRPLTSTNSTSAWRKPTTHIECDIMNKPTEGLSAEVSWVAGKCIPCRALLRYGIIRLVDAARLTCIRQSAESNDLR